MRRGGVVGGEVDGLVKWRDDDVVVVLVGKMMGW